MAHYCGHNCIGELTLDHEKILAKVNELEKAISGLVDQNEVKEFLEFTETFVEPHLQKEEKVLFPALEKKGMLKEGGPIGMMLFEHKTKRGYVKKLKEGFDEGSEKKIKENSQAVISLLRDHIFKENNVLYPCAKDILNQEEISELGRQCEKIKSR